MAGPGWACMDPSMIRSPGARQPGRAQQLWPKPRVPVLTVLQVITHWAYILTLPHPLPQASLLNYEAREMSELMPLL